MLAYPLPSIVLRTPMTIIRGMRRILAREPELPEVSAQVIVARH